MKERKKLQNRRGYGEERRRERENGEGDTRERKVFLQVFVDP